ncbi:GNAT family N-acetyltransferase [Lacrimispora sp.]|uniref:GNAT family N-acetyltransferase n=1 Tax=Lacrimispora sp. TaxID=2719234 RepID=UPI002FDA8CBC
MKFLDFERDHVESAKLIAVENYYEEREYVPILPGIDVLPDLEYFACNGLGVAAFEGDRLIGFLCCYEPWDNAFGSSAKGTFSPIHAHGAVKENRRLIYQKMYQAAAEKWVKRNITYHAVAHYAHDTESINAFFTYGFGLRCMDAIRPMAEFECQPCDGIYFEELPKTDVIRVRQMRQMESEHMGNSPCFMYSSSENFKSWLAHAEERTSRLFVANNGEKLIAFVEVKSNGENFVTESDNMCNICGAFCLPEFRGKDIYQNLLNFTILKLKTEGYKILGVDFESFNPTGYGFWLKYFTAYTNSVVRRIDECALHD